MRLKPIFVLFVLIVFSPLMSAFAEPTQEDIAKAIRSMRGIDPYGLSQEQQKAKASELGEAWKVIIGAGPKGISALKAEIKRIDDKKERDDHFKLGAAALLWHIGKVEEAPAIAAIWSGDVDLHASDNYVFFTAFDAARTQDPRVLPMLAATLRDYKGAVFIPQHSLTIRGPLFHEFIWGTFGPKGVPTLEHVLYHSAEDHTLDSAIYLLAKAQDLNVIDRIREIARKGKRVERYSAIAALGAFGHPQDFDFLITGLKNSKDESAFFFVYALYEYGDLRAVPHIIPFLSAKEDVVGAEAVTALVHLATPEGIAALQQCSEKNSNNKRKEECAKAVERLPKPSDPVRGSGATKKEAENSEIASTLRERAADKYRMKASDRVLTHEELLSAAEEWKKNHRIRGGTYSWVEDRHVMAAATAADLPMLMDVEAAVYMRLSDEALYEIRTLQQLIRRLGRSRYRKDAGVCGKVEPL